MSSPMHVRFSILVPVFKTKYLKQSIESILAQEYRDFEIIIVNDKSPEDVSFIINAFDDDRISYYENEINLGRTNVVLNWNKCLGYANGEFALLFSDDDFLDPKFLIEIADLIRKYPNVDLFYSRVGVVDSSSKVIRFTPSAPEFENLLDFMWHRFSGLREMYAQNFVFRLRKLTEMDGFVDFPLAWASDDATWFSLAFSNGVVSTNKVLCYWRFSELNISNIGSIGMRLDALKKYFLWVDVFLQKYQPQNEHERLLYDQINLIKVIWKAKLESALVANLFKQNSYFKSVLILMKLITTNELSFKFIIKSCLKPVLKR
ncbi:MAG: glycosyltransferase family 2 protein [Mucilaginibacter sp.]